MSTVATSRKPELRGTNRQLRSAKWLSPSTSHPEGTQAPGDCQAGLFSGQTRSALLTSQPEPCPAAGTSVSTQVFSDGSEQTRGYLPRPPFSLRWFSVLEVITYHQDLGKEGAAWAIIRLCQPPLGSPLPRGLRCGRSFLPGSPQPWHLRAHGCRDEVTRLSQARRSGSPVAPPLSRPVRAAL